MEPMGSARGGARGARARAVKGPAARTLGKACARGLPGLCYLLSVSWPARHFLTAPSTGRGQGPSPVSKGFSLGFPAPRLAPRSWEAWLGVVRVRGASPASCCLVPGHQPRTQAGAALAPRAHPQARRQRDTALRLSAASPPPRPWGPSPLCPHPFLLPPYCRLPSESSPHGAPALPLAGVSCLLPPCAPPLHHGRVKGGDASVPRAQRAGPAGLRMNVAGRWASQGRGRPGPHVKTTPLG